MPRLSPAGEYGHLAAAATRDVAAAAPGPPPTTPRRAYLTPAAPISPRRNRHLCPPARDTSGQRTSGAAPRAMLTHLRRRRAAAAAGTVGAALLRPLGRADRGGRRRPARGWWGVGATLRAAAARPLPPTHTPPPLCALSLSCAPLGRRRCRPRLIVGPPSQGTPPALASLPVASRPISGPAREGGPGHKCPLLTDPSPPGPCRTRRLPARVGAHRPLSTPAPRHPPTQPLSPSEPCWRPGAPAMAAVESTVAPACRVRCCTSALHRRGAAAGQIAAAGGIQVGGAGGLSP